MAALILASSSYLCAQSPSKPVPTQWLHDGRLFVPEFNFSIESPDPDSHWSYQELPNVQGFRTTVFVADASAEEKYSVISWESASSGRMDDAASKKRFMEDMTKALPNGWRVDGDAHVEPTAVPWAGSWKVKTSIRRPTDGLILYAYLYAVTGKRTYMFITYSPQAIEPLQFTRFVGSFVLLSPSANDVAAPPPNLAVGLLWIAAIVGAVVDWQYKRQGGVRPNKEDRLYALVGVLLCVGLVVTLAVLGSSPEALGRLTGLLAALVFAVWELGRWRVRRRNPLPPRPRI